MMRREEAIGKILKRLQAKVWTSMDKWIQKDEYVLQYRNYWAERANHPDMNFFEAQLLMTLDIACTTKY
jgi:hypothetical protein